MKKPRSRGGYTNLHFTNNRNIRNVDLLECTDRLLRNRKLKYKLQVAQRVLLLFIWTLVLLKYCITDRHTTAGLNSILRQKTLGSFSEQEIEDHSHVYIALSSLYGEVFLTDGSKQRGIYMNWAKVKDGKHYVKSRGKCKGIFSYNDKIGNALPVDRDIWDTRPKICAKELENFTLSSTYTVSVVIPFHNEQLSTLMRTLISVSTQSNSDILREIILVDDKSTDDLTCLQEELEKAIFTLKTKVRSLRL